MNLLKKKKDEDLTLPETSSKGEKLVRKERIRRKESPQPWGKRERILVLLVLMLTILSSAFLALSARNWKLPGLPRLEPKSFSLLKNETITLEGDGDKLRDVFKANEAVAKFKEMTNELSGMYGLWVVNLENGFSYGVNQNATFQAASLIKLPVMLAMYREEERGSLSLSNKYKLRNSDKVGGAGSLQYELEGDEVSYRDLIRLMGKQSDNTAFNICKNLLGPRKLDETIGSIGMKNTDFAENKTTPEDMGLFFQKLWQGSLINDENKNQFLEFLTDTLYEQWLAAGISDEVQVAHKYGREIHVVNDAGIVFTDHPFVIVMMSEGVVEREADKIFPELARMVYEMEVK